LDFSFTRILVVDDDDAIRETLQESLLAMGYVNVQTASDGEEALEILSRGEIELLLLDLAMPRLRGEEVVEVALGRNSDLIIIIVTGFATLEKAVNLMKKGVYDLLRKPFNPHTLIKKVESALVKHRARGEKEGKDREFGEFELLEEISRGGVGVVWKALERDSGSTVALKILLAGREATDEQVIRFHREANTIAKLRHPHIVAIRQVGVHEGRHFIAMDYIDGKPLDEWVEFSDPPLRTVIDVLARAAMALHYAHEREILHRDLKPSNILVDGRLQPHLIDFGLALSIRDDLRVTEGNRLHGTVGYIAPERFSEKAGAQDGRVDIFSLGVILYEILTGTIPYRLVKECGFLPDFSHPPVHPNISRPNLPNSISEAALKATALQPADRFSSAREFFEALTQDD
jgi:serine/threonine protein kinase